MIKSKSDLKYYLYQDSLALQRPGRRPRIFGDHIFKFEVSLRRAEYYLNCRRDLLGKLLYYWYRYRLCVFANKCCGYLIPLNAVGPGLALVHKGAIVIHYATKIGRNCRIQEGVTIGGKNGIDKAATIGDNVFIGSGAKIIGELSIADDIAIGANAVVTKSFDTPGVTLAGVPAKVINNSNSHSNLSKYLFEDNDTSGRLKA